MLTFVCAGQDEIGTLRVELIQLQDDTNIPAVKGTNLSDDMDGTNDFQSITSLKEKVKKLEFEVQSLRSGTGEHTWVEDVATNRYLWICGVMLPRLAGELQWRECHI